MAQPTDTFSSYDAIGNREDLSDIIYNISPTDTPFMSSIGKGKAKGVLHEWQTDSLAAANGNNAAVEGDDAAGTAASATSRVGNRTQISTKTIIVSGTQEAVDKAGRSSEFNYQLAKRSKELKRDMETILLSNQAPVTGDDSTARKLRPLTSWYASNVSGGTGAANGSTSAGRTDGTQRALTETILKAVLKSCFDNGGNPDTIMVGSFNKQTISSFTAGTTKNTAAEDKKLVASVDVYESDFGVLKVIPNRFQRARDCHIVDTDMAAVDYLRNFQTMDLARTGDSEKKQLLVEYTLRVNNEAAHGIAADLLTS